MRSRRSTPVTTMRPPQDRQGPSPPGRRFTKRHTARLRPHPEHVRARANDRPSIENAQSRGPGLPGRRSARSRGLSFDGADGRSINVQGAWSPKRQAWLRRNAVT
jgi:hypothetical protein